MNWNEYQAAFEAQFGMPVPEAITIGPIKVAVTLMPNGSILLGSSVAIVTWEEFAQFLRVASGTHPAKVVCGAADYRGFSCALSHGHNGAHAFTL